MQFATKQPETNLQLLAAIQSGDNQLAERIAHTVKGVAGNIGLCSVFTSAEKLERALREKDPQIPAVVKEFTLAVNRQIQAIQQAMRDLISDRPAEEGARPEFDPGAATAAITRLRALLEASDADAAEAFHDLECALLGISGKLRLTALSEAINEFDFEAARLRLDEIAREFDVNRGQTK